MWLEKLIPLVTRIRSFGDEAGLFNTTGNWNTFVGYDTGALNTEGGGNTSLGWRAGHDTTTGNSNTFVGYGSGTTNITGSNNLSLGYNADVSLTGLNYATAIGSGAVVSTSNTVQLGRADGSDTVFVPGSLRVNSLGLAGSTQVCRNASNQISTCSSSLRYKTNINRFGYGLSLINRLKPITFDWKDGGTHDLGLGAEDVAAVEPMLVTYNANGQVEGVKYDRVSVVLINAVKEQQAQIESLQITNAQQQRQIEMLLTIVCSLKPNAGGCKQEEK